MTAPFDWRNPDYGPIFQQRAQRLARLRENPQSLAALKLFYKDNPGSFIDDWGMTYDPRRPEVGLPSTVPLLLFQRQRELVEFFLDCWHKQSPGLVEKSRDVGASWVAMSFACAMCLHHTGVTIGVGSRKEELIDRSGDPSTLFFKARMFMQNLPPDFRGGWDVAKNSAHMRLTFPETGSALVGEAGDNIGRGARTSMYIVDEAAYLERPQLIEASLSATTNCRLDLSSVNGRANSFAEKRFSGRVPVFTFMWRADPRKSNEWYRQQCERLDPVTVASEIDLSYSASVEGILIPAPWVQAAVDAHRVLGITPTGMKNAALDVADEGFNKSAFAARHGILLAHCESWSGKNADIFATVVRAFNLCDTWACETLSYDADGLGSGARGDSRIVNEQRVAAGLHEIRDTPFRGSASVWDPESELIYGSGRKNKDLFANAKAQAWWELRSRFQNTFRAVVEHAPVDDVDSLISISSTIPELNPLLIEISQPTFSVNSVGKILVDKSPDGARSPDLADAAMICFAPGESRTLELWIKLGEDPRPISYARGY